MNTSASVLKRAGPEMILLFIDFKRKSSAFFAYLSGALAGVTAKKI
jgi:hypothetical protein